MRWIPNPLRVGTIGIITTVMVILAGLNYDALPLIGAHRICGGHFADTGGLKVGDDVQVAGVTVGKVEDVRIDGDAVRIDFVDDPVGDRSNWRSRPRAHWAACSSMSPSSATVRWLRIR